MKIQPIAHKSLSETVAGKLAASLLDGSLLARVPNARRA